MGVDAMSTFTDIRDQLVKIGLPLLGAALPVPGGMAIASALASAIGSSSNEPQALLTALADPATLEKAKEFEATHAETMLKLNIQAEVDAAAAVNKTMQVEAASDHWPTYSWRPFIGFMFGCYIASMWLLPLAGQTPVKIDADLTLAIGGILGVASFFRGKMQANPAQSTDNRG
jgi:hypothetical protein